MILTQSPVRSESETGYGCLSLDVGKGLGRWLVLLLTQASSQALLTWDPLTETSANGSSIKSLPVASVLAMSLKDVITPDHNTNY